MSKYCNYYSRIEGEHLVYYSGETGVEVYREIFQTGYNYYTPIMEGTE